MPTYEYECQKCGHSAERFEPMSASAPKQCPKCKAPKAFVRQIGRGAGIIFRGSGFYETDYKRKSSGGTRVPETPTPVTPEPKKSDTKTSTTASKD